MSDLLLPAELGNALLGYLADRPWRESHALIEALRALEPVIEDPKEQPTQ